MSIDPETNIDAATGEYVEPTGIGISWLWKLPDDHWLYWPAVWHDLQYDLRRCGMRSDSKSSDVDREFYARAKKRAGDDTVKLVEADIALAIVQVVGKYRWPEVETDAAKVELFMSEGIKKLRMLREAGEL